MHNKYLIYELDTSGFIYFNEIKNKLPKCIINNLNNKSCFIWWWVIRNYFENEKNRDIDIFCTDKIMFLIILEEIKINTFNILLEKENFIKFTYNNKEVDLSFIEWTNNVIDLLENSDFTISKWILYKNSIIHYKSFINDIINKKLIYTWSSNPWWSYIRLEKFQKKWFTINDNDYQEIIRDIWKKQKMKLSLRKLNQK